MGKKVRKIPQGAGVVFRRWITLRNGKRLEAAAYGLKAWPLKVRK